VDLQNDFTTGDNRYPKNRQQTLHLLDKYSKTVVARVTQSEGNSFSKRGGRGSGYGNNNESSTYAKKWWKSKECYRCQKKGHPVTHCPKSDKDNGKKSMASTAINVNKLKKYFKTMKKAFTMVNAQCALMKEVDSDISESDGDEENSHFQVDDALQFAHVDK
jgi:hypothetical protein